MTGNCHVRCEAGENPEITSKDYLSLLGQIPDFEKILAVVRSYNIRVCIILQDLSQLEALYKDTYRGIIANCAIMTFLGTTENETLKQISERLGNISVETDSRSYNRTGAGGGQDTESKASRPLLTPDEVKEAVKPTLASQKYDGHCIVWVGYERPFYLLKYDTISHPNIHKMGGPEGTEQSCRNTYIEDIYTIEKVKLKLEAHTKQLDEEVANDKANEKEEKEAEQRKFEQSFAEYQHTEQPPKSVEEEHNRDDATFDVEYTDEGQDETYQSSSDYDNEMNQNPAYNRILEIEKQNQKALEEKELPFVEETSDTEDKDFKGIEEDIEISEEDFF